MGVSMIFSSLHDTLGCYSQTQGSMHAFLCKSMHINMRRKLALFLRPDLRRNFQSPISPMKAMHEAMQDELR